MSKTEMRVLLAAHLAKYRIWSYAQLAERVERDRRSHDCLEHIEGTTSNGASYQVEISAVWDDRPRGDVRVLADLSTEPQKRVLGFLPIFASDVTDSFIMSPDGRFVGESQLPAA